MYGFWQVNERCACFLCRTVWVSGCLVWGASGEFVTVVQKKTIIRNWLILIVSDCTVEATFHFLQVDVQSITSVVCLCLFNNLCCFFVDFCLQPLMQTPGTSGGCATNAKQEEVAAVHGAVFAVNRTWAMKCGLVWAALCEELSDAQWMKSCKAENS